MKQILLTMMVAVMLLPAMVACSKSNDDDPKLYATESEIQGKWGCVGEYASYIFQFDKGQYSIFMQSGRDTEYEYGSYTMGANGTITLTRSNGKDSPWSPLEAYWEGSTKTTLHFWPVGSFTRMSK